MTHHKLNALALGTFATRAHLGVRDANTPKLLPCELLFLIVMIISSLLNGMYNRIIKGYISIIT